MKKILVITARTMTILSANEPCCWGYAGVLAVDSAGAAVGGGTLLIREIGFKGRFTRWHAVTFQ